jgi:hypothetical protein
MLFREAETYRTGPEGEEVMGKRRCLPEVVHPDESGKPSTCDMRRNRLVRAVQNIHSLFAGHPG